MVSFCKVCGHLYGKGLGMLGNVTVGHDVSCAQIL